MKHFSIERDYLLREIPMPACRSNRDALSGDPLANDRVDHRASANRACGRSLCLT